MKIEKINENQIRCILTKEDLASRHLRLSELAYGSDKAKDLFRDMMQEASYRFGFDAEDIPLMIEAIPMTAESLILVISKVEYPEELDTRFSRFSENAAGSYYEDGYSYDNKVSSEGADNILDMFRKIRDEHTKQRSSENMTDSEFVPLSETAPVIEEIDPADIKAVPIDRPEVEFQVTKLFVFRSIDDLMRLSRVLNGLYTARNSLYKNPRNHRYYLVAASGSHTPEEFNRVCNILAEYGVQEKYSPAEEAHFSERYETILSDQAVQTIHRIP